MPMTVTLTISGSLRKKTRSRTSTCHFDGMEVKMGSPQDRSTSPMLFNGYSAATSFHCDTGYEAMSTIPRLAKASISSESDLETCSHSSTSPVMKPFSPAIELFSSELETQNTIATFGSDIKGLIWQINRYAFDEVLDYEGQFTISKNADGWAKAVTIPIRCRDDLLNLTAELLREIPSEPQPMSPLRLEFRRQQ